MRWMPWSLTVKIALVVLAVSLLSVGLVAIFSGWTTVREYDNLLLEQVQGNFADYAAAYYEAEGSWQGFSEAVLHAYRPEDRGRPLRRLPPDRENPAAFFPFVLLDANGCVVGPPSQVYRPGDCLPARLVNSGTAVEVADQRVGTVIPTGAVMIRDPREELFLARTGRGLLWGAVGASIVALLLGIGLASTLTRPLRRLTTAIHAMAEGKLEQRVDVQSHDEIGELASAFNRMSVELTQSNQARRQMTADVAHELRNPLMVITGYLEVLRDGVLTPTPEHFEILHEEAQHLQRLVADLRTLSLADAGELVLHRQIVAADTLLVRVAEAYAPAAEKQGISIVTVVTGKSPDVAVDVERMVQVLANLVTNAMRHTPAGGEIRLGAHAESGGVALTVADTGEGIAPEVLPHIFDRFYRADPARSQTGDESGLGLAIARSIVAAHGGALTVTSTLGEGSVFTIHIPNAADQKMERGWTRISRMNENLLIRVHPRQIRVPFSLVGV